MPDLLLKTLRKIGDFQAEYEGSIPFTRSKIFNDLARQEIFILTSRAHRLGGSRSRNLFDQRMRRV